MSYEKYYDERNGLYILHFPNNKGLSVEAVKEIFSAYGNIAAVNNRGQTTGLCFVKCKTVEDAIRCVEGLENHEFIKILPHKRKQDDKSGNESGGQTGDRFTSQAHNDYKNKNNRKSDGNARTFRKNPNNKKNDTDNGWWSDRGSDSCSTKSRQSQKLDDPSIPRKDESSPHYAKLKALKSLTSSTYSSSSSIPALSNKIHQTNNYAGEIPKLVSTDESTDVDSKTSLPASRNLLSASYKIIPAEEIIVANIHSDYGIHYILHLFEKYNPISVSLMEVIPSSAIRYCHVYFKTWQEAIATEREFDNYFLSGKNLMVFTPQKLIEEAFATQILINRM